MLTRFGHTLLVLAVIAATGLHWLVLQSVAWTTMFAGNLQSTSLVQALEQTFDGKHPCCLCRQITKAQQAEKKPDAKPEGKKLEYSYTSFRFVFTAPARFFELNPASEIAFTRTLAPPLPPPKQLAG